MSILSDNPNYLIAAVLAFVLSFSLTPVVIWWANKFRILDIPNNPRKIHTRAIPLLGGLAIFISFFTTLFLILSYRHIIFQPLAQNQGIILPKHILGIFIASLVIMLAGVIDDKYRLKPMLQLVGPAIAVIIVLISGIGISFITNPFGGLIYLDHWQTRFLTWGGIHYYITWIADAFTVIWLMSLMYTTKLLDGLDGLVTGITALAAMFIFFLSLSIHQPFTALMAIILCAANIGFLIFNFNPAKIFLGESGSLWAGFMIGILAIVSGGKVATAVLILGIPILDLIWVSSRRLFTGKSIADADKKHIHHRLLQVGLSQREAVFVLYFLTSAFGVAALFLQSFGKLVALAVLAVTMLILGVILIWLKKPSDPKQNYVKQ